MSKQLVRALYSLFLVPCCCFFQSCSNGSEKNFQQAGSDTLRERMIAVNKIMVDNESARIAEFIKRHQWTMDSTGTGLRYWIYTKANGTVPKLSDKVKINYKLFLLDGTTVYESGENKPLEFTLGRGESTKGLEEALMLMHAGSKAWVVVPKYLGYGMTGDEKKIPGNATLLYDVELVSVN